MILYHVCVCVSTIAFLVEIAFVDDYHCKLVVATAAAAAVAFRLRSINVNNNNKTTKRELDLGAAICRHLSRGSGSHVWRFLCVSSLYNNSEIFTLFC